MTIFKITDIYPNTNGGPITQIRITDDHKILVYARDGKVHTLSPEDINELCNCLEFARVRAIREAK